MIRHHLFRILILASVIAGAGILLTQHYFHDPLYSTKFIIVVLDALRADHVGTYGYERNTTPNIDHFARQSFIFTEAFSAASYTLASTASLFTSTYSPRHSAITKRDSLPTNSVTLAEVLRDHGFATAAFSHAPFVSESFGLQQGFDSFYSIGKQDRLDASVPFDRAASWLRRNKYKDFFVYIHIIPPHTPYDPPRPYDTAFADEKYTGQVKATSMHILKMDRGEVAFGREDVQRLIDLYDGNILYADAAFGEFLGHLERLGLYDETTIIVASDHGEAFGEHGRLLHNTTVYDEMIHIPLVIKPSGGTRRAIYVRSIVSNIDVMPTFLDMAKIDYRELDLQGESLRPLFQGKNLSKSRFVFANSTGGTYSVRMGDFKLIHYGRGRSTLFRVGDVDPLETDDVSDEYPDITRMIGAVLFDVLADKGRKSESKSRGADEGPELSREMKDALRALGYMD